jgi:hypothetical protein
MKVLGATLFQHSYGGIVRVRDASAEAAKSRANGAAEQQPLAEVKLFQESVEHRAVATRLLLFCGGQWLRRR